MDIWTWGAAVAGGASVLLGRSLAAAVATDVARRISVTMWGVRLFDTLTPSFVRHAIWSGEWEVSWEVDSTTFEPVNSESAEISRCFNTIALEASGTTRKGVVIPYGFVGKFSRDKSIITGTWFDRRGGDGGYHGAYQLRMQGSGDEAVGLWIGFSETSSLIKSGPLSWKRL